MEKKALNITGCIFIILGIIFAVIAMTLITIYFRKGQIRDTQIEPPPQIIIEDIQNKDESTNSAMDE